MIITEIAPYTKGRYKIYMDDEFAFVLYKGDISSCGLKAGEEVSEATFHTIMNEILPKRAFSRALNLLEHKDYTEREIRTKLTEGLYPDSVTDAAIDMLISNRFIDDLRYATRFVELHYVRESLLALKQKLSRHGIQKSVIDTAVERYREDHEDSGEESVLRGFISRKNIRIDELSFEEIQKLRLSLLRKGFSYEAIASVLKSSDFE